MLQATETLTTSSGLPGTPEDELAGLVTAMYDVASHARRFQAQDPVDTARVALLYQIRFVGPLRPSDLATISRLDLSTVSRHLKELESVGYIARFEDPLDRRAFRVSITAQGEEVLNTVVANRVEALRDVLGRWPAQDRAQLGHLLRRLADDLATEYCSAPTPNPHTTQDIQETA